MFLLGGQAKLPRQRRGNCHTKVKASLGFAGQTRTGPQNSSPKQCAKEHEIPTKPLLLPVQSTLCFGHARRARWTEIFCNEPAFLPTALQNIFCATAVQRACYLLLFSGAYSWPLDNLGIAHV